MQNTTADYKIEINKPSRQFECKITIGNNIYTNEDLVNLILEYTQPQEGFAIGNTISQSLDLTLLNRGDIIYSTSQIKVEIGLKIGSTIEYILMGIFNIDDIEKTDYTTKFTAYDNMIKFETAYFSSLGDKPTLQQVVNELSSKTGVEFTGSLPAYTVSKLDGFSCREVLSYVASICGGNAFITRDGKFTIKTLSEVEKYIDGSNYVNYTREEIKYKIGQISCQVDENNTLSKGSIGTDSMELVFENPWVTETILTEIYNKLNGLSYLGYSMKWQGDISLDPCDIITVTDVKNVVRKIPILSQKLSYTGGLTSEIGAKGETKNKNSFSTSGSTTNKVNRAVIEQAIIKEALIEKANIKDLEAVSIRTQTLEAKTAKVEEAIIGVAHIKDLNAINANIQNLIAADAKINNALINKADIVDLNAVKGTINVLNSDVANIKTLVNGNLSSENIQAGGITSDKLTIANGFIKNAMIDSLDVSKVNAGDISTNKFRIVSDSGKMLIADNTIQIRDNNRARVQIGKDASNDYNMYVWDNAGNLMFDATGLQADGIKNKIIRDDMISDNANIDGSKINIGSLVTEINKDTNTSVIKSSKVQLDTVGQTLDVAFNSLKTNVDNIQVGGRNYVLNSDAYITGNSDKQFDFSILQELRGKTVTVSVEIDLVDAQGTRVGFEPSIIYADGTTQYLGIWQSISSATTAKKRICATHTIQDKEIKSYSQRGIYIQGVSSGTARIGRPKLEIGNKATDWTPAPEDINSSIDAVKQITENNSTTINVMQGQISTAINNTQIVKDGQTVLLKDDYNRTVAKVDSIDSTIGTHTTKIDQLTGNITSVDTKVNSVQRDLEGTKSIVSSHSTNIDNLSSTVSTQGSSINQLKDQIALKVEKTDIANAINNLQVGGRNYVFNSDAYITGNNFVNFDFSILQELRGKTITVSVEIDLNAAKGSRVGFEPSIIYADGTTQHLGVWQSISSTTTMKKRIFATHAILDKEIISYEQRGIYIQGVISGTTRIGRPKLEIGNQATDWTPAPEDVDSAISTVDSRVTSTNNKVASIETNVSSITSRVSTTENNVKTINGNVSSLQSRMSSAEQKITSSAIISTVQSTINNARNEAINSANSSTDNKLNNYATKSSMELTASQLKLTFASSGGMNLIKDGQFKSWEFNTGKWEYSEDAFRIYGRGSNDPKGTSIGFYSATDGKVDLYQYVKFKPGTTYTFRADIYKEPNIWWYAVIIDFYDGSGHYLGSHTCTEAGNTFTTPRNCYKGVLVIRHGGTSNFNGNYVLYVNNVSIYEGTMELPYSPHPDEIYEGNTVIDAQGIKIYNGALTVYNNNNEAMVKADDGGNLTFKGRLQPNDYQLKLFGNECKIDGSANAIRMQLTPQIYCGMDSEGGFRIFNQHSNLGARYTSILMTPEGHSSMYNDRTRIKLLGAQNDRPVVQSRNTGDNAYGDFHGADFLNRSTIKDKTNVQDTKELDCTKIILENDIFKYNLKSDVQYILEKFGLNEEYDLSDIEGCSADERVGFILEELTEEAKTLLSPGDMESISIYSMCSILWKAFQEQQKRIETLESLLKK